MQFKTSGKLQTEMDKKKGDKREATQATYMGEKTQKDGGGKRGLLIAVHESKQRTPWLAKVVGLCSESDSTRIGRLCVVHLQGVPGLRQLRVHC